MMRAEGALGTVRAVVPSRPLSNKERHLRDVLSTWVTAKFKSTERQMYAITLTCKQAIGGRFGQLVWLTPELLSNELKVFFKRLDWQVYKNASRRRKKRIERFCVIEGGIGTGKRLHVHALVLAPSSKHMDPRKFLGIMKSHWASSRWGMADDHFDIPESPLAAVRYLTKTGLDAIDWINTEV